MQPISQTTHDLNKKLLVHYTSHGLNNELLAGYSGHGLNDEPFDKRTILDQSNTQLVRFSDSHCDSLSCGFHINHFWFMFLGSCQGKAWRASTWFGHHQGWNGRWRKWRQVHLRLLFFLLFFLPFFFLSYLLVLYNTLFASYAVSFLCPWRMKNQPHLFYWSVVSWSIFLSYFCL